MKRRTGRKLLMPFTVVNSFFNSKQRATPNVKFKEVLNKLGNKQENTREVVNI